MRRKRTYLHQAEFGSFGGVVVCPEIEGQQPFSERLSSEAADVCESNVRIFMYRSLCNLGGMLFHRALHFSQPHRLEQLQAVANHNCQVQRKFVPDDWIRDEMFAQLFPG